MHTAGETEDNEREWVDWRWGWLAERIGEQLIQSAPVFTRAEEFVSRTSPLSEPDMQALAEQIVDRLGLGAWRVELVKQTGTTVEEEAAFDEQFESALRDPDTLVVGVSHDLYTAPQLAAISLIKSLAVAYLDRKGWVDCLGPGAWSAGELAAVMLGAGVILTNNSVVTENTSDGVASYFRTQRITTLSEPGLSYALARFAYLRGEDAPSWLNKLRPDPRQLCKRYLAAFQTDTPPKNAPKPDWVLDTWEQVEAAQQDEEDWDEDELFPSILHDAETAGPRFYCRACAQELTGMDASDCPGCNKPFDPEDLRTVTTIKPAVVSETTHRVMTQSARLTKRMVKLIIYVLVAALVVSIIVSC